MQKDDERQNTGAEPKPDTPEAAEEATESSDDAGSDPSKAQRSQASWDELGLSDAALKLIHGAGFAEPTVVQGLALPIALDGRDLIASSQTGSGKTAAFVLPMVERFAGREGTFGLILAPTREIAQQIQTTIDVLGGPRGVRSIVLIGGINMRLDQQALDTYPQIIVATPGRLCDHLERGNIWLDFIEILVLDEADRMLDMGFSDQLARITEELPESRQTLLFSATIPPSVQRLASKILKDPEKIAVGKPLSAARNIDQCGIWVSEDARMRELRRLLRDEPGTTIVFTRSKDEATRVWRSLHSAGFYDATYIHSDRLQAHREQALAEFKSGKFRIMIATDVAARGIHVDGVAHVINYELPMEAEDYIHRIGRTGRLDARGKATTLVAGRDRRTLAAIEKLLGHPLTMLNPDFVPGGGSRDGSRFGGSRSGSSRQGGSRPSAQGAAGTAPSSGGENKRRRSRRGGRGRRGKPGSGSPQA